jgi:hypothetical protein
LIAGYEPNAKSVRQQKRSSPYGLDERQWRKIQLPQIFHLRSSPLYWELQVYKAAKNAEFRNAVNS